MAPNQSFREALNKNHSKKTSLCNKNNCFTNWCFSLKIALLPNNRKFSFLFSIHILFHLFMSSTPSAAK